MPDPWSCIATELDLVEKALLKSIRSAEPTLTEIAAHLIHGGGKRVRPMITLLAFKALGGKQVEDIIEIATALELIHTATLLHDDIIDDAESRRGKESAYKRYGLKSTLVTGDFLFIKAFEYAGKFDETVVQWTADACTRLTEGEILQGAFNRNIKVTLSDYLEIVKRKTASLFQTGAKLGAYMAGASSSQINGMDQFALNLGIAFQMVDDVLDVVGHRDLLGKPTGIDLRDGNPSLPIVLSIGNSHNRISHTFKSAHPTGRKIKAALDAMCDGTAIDQAMAFSREYAYKAFSPIEELPPSPYLNSMKSLVQLIVERNS